MQKVIDILIERDGLTESEAVAEIEEARQLMDDCGYNYDEVENIMYEILGLEMDYIFDVLNI